MNYLYTLPNCKACEDSRQLINNEIYKEVTMEDPFSRNGNQAAFGRVIHPVLVKENGELLFLFEDSEGNRKFAKMIG